MLIRTLNRTLTHNGSQVYLVADLNAQTIKIAIT
jgi:hypothetical protein